jgi:hypothetical protein
MAEIIALGRHPTMWVRAVSPIYLFALVGLAGVTVATQLLILNTQRATVSLSSLRWTRTALPTAIAIVALVVCPEWPIYNRSTIAHILTVAVGALVVFVPMRLLLPELVLNGSDEHGMTPIFGTREWILLAAGVVVVLFGFWPDATKANRPMGHMHLPIVVAEIAELFIAYALLGASLGFGRSLNNAMQSQHANK